MGEALQVATLYARLAKEAATHRGLENLPTTVACYRGAVLVAVLELPWSDRDPMLLVADAAARGFAPDLLSVAFETFHATTELNPLTGRDWGPGEMQDLAENHDGRAKRWVTDAVLLHVGNRAGDLTERMLPYRQAGRRVEWLTDDHPVEWTNAPGADARISGRVPSALTRIMTDPDITHALHQAGVSGEDFGLTPEQVHAHTDCAVTRMLMQPPAEWVAAGFPDGVDVTLACRAGSVREQVIRRSLPEVRRLRTKP